LVRDFKTGKLVRNPKLEKLGQTGIPTLKHGDNIVTGSHYCIKYID
jgi:hypothetical protein